MRIADQVSGWLFWVVATLSVATLLVDPAVHPKGADVAQLVFVLAVVANFMLGMLTRFHWSPRAEDKRREELLSNAFGVNLTHERTQGYYNNDESASVRRLAVVLLENSFFSKNVACEMAVHERFKVAGYFSVWFIAILNRSSELAWIAVTAQVLFSENLISKLVRIEWLRMRFERAYDELYGLLQCVSSFDDNTFRSKVINLFGLYETGKAYGGIVLSSKIFFRRNAELSDDWSRVKAALGL